MSGPRHSFQLDWGMHLTSTVVSSKRLVLKGATDVGAEKIRYLLRM